MQDAWAEIASQGGLAADYLPWDVRLSLAMGDMWPLAASAAKVSRNGLHRTVSPETTFERTQPYHAAVGITRLADITGLDRIGIPVYSAIVPRSRDVLSIYNGKGVLAADARTGAVMEAIERYVASFGRLPAAVGSYRELSSGNDPIIDPRSVNMALTSTYDDSTVLAWVKGVDLISRQSFLVPHALACYQCFHYPWQIAHRITTTNGLASGNTLEEATCHALTEVIERDALSLMDVIDRQILVVKNRSAAFSDYKLEAFKKKKEDLYPSIALDSLSEPALSLVKTYLAAGIVPHLHRLTCDTGIATVICMITEDIDLSFSTTHHGVGTDPDPRIAIIRALTEAAQSRAVDMQAVREDLTSSDAVVEKHLAHSQRGDQRGFDNWLTRSTARPVAESDLVGARNSDIVEDIHFMLSHLKQVGLSHAIMVDLSLPELPVKVVRVIVPGLESWAIDQGKVGNRARAAWRQFLEYTN